MLAMRLGVLGLGGIGAGCTTGPANGTAIDVARIDATFEYSGYTNTPGEVVTLEVLADPTLDPAVNASWVSFGSATTSLSPTMINSSESALYRWTTHAAPVTSRDDPARWRNGGVVRTRAKRASGSVLTTFDEPAFPCLAEHYLAGEDWATIGSACAGVSNGRVQSTRAAGGHVGLASTTLSPLNLAASQKPDWLGRKGDITPDQTSDYYAAWGAPVSLAAFRTRYGFTSGDVTATYYNDGDLGLGREMHCRALLGRMVPDVGIACYVTNYSGVAGKAVFNEPATTVLADAVARVNSFATVAMVYNRVKQTTNFVVYGASGEQALTAQLDSTKAHVSIPNVCLECHGIDSSYDSTTHAIIDPNVSAGPAAQFLAFDPFSFKFSTAPGFTQHDQESAFRQLNALIARTSPTAATADLITGMYAPKLVTDPTAVANNDYVPSGWAAADITQDGNTMYRGVVKRGCRGCHASASHAELDFLELADWTPLLATIRYEVCARTSGSVRGHAMPQAERVSKQFWNSGARALVVSYTQPAATTFPDPTASCDP